MTDKFASKLLPALILGCSIMVTACGGGGSSKSSPTTTGDNTDTGSETPVQYAGVEGPLDALQDPLSTQVFGGLSSAAAGTPLEAALTCLGQVVAEDVIDILDAFAAIDPATGDPQAAFESATANAQLAATELTVDLPNTLASLVGQGDCTTSSTDSSGSDNPLAGTPLEALGTALAAALANGGDPSSMSPAQLAVLFQELAAAFSEGTSSLPPEVTSAPILSGALDTIGTALTDLGNVALAAASSDGVAVSGTTTQTVDNLLKNVLINVLPVAFLEEQADQDGVVSDQIDAGVSALSAQLFTGLSTVMVPLFDGIGTLMDAITGSMAGGDDGQSTGPTYTPLDEILGPLADAAAGFSSDGESGTGPTGTPLDVLLAPIASAIEGGGAAACPLADTPLSTVCDAVDGILAQLLGALSV
ncbi:hypothetical protein IB286_03440 [Spongiibacter sp. KMU-158]|uniref:Uncharacterized protein n=1 Tax=Spongiibacter pelagi TaxID=2760804 RepID=A0A927GVG5_9GAMM|nr:hypothetical protein [Spongiibacter pelagi]MBD2858048.1 hypothetical protein [Spongiibacter pelagi]